MTLRRRIEPIHVVLPPLARRHVQLRQRPAKLFHGRQADQPRSLPDAPVGDKTSSACNEQHRQQHRSSGTTYLIRSHAG